MLAALAAVTWSAYSYWSEYSERAARKAREMMAPSVGAQCQVILRNQEIDGSKNTSHRQFHGQFVQLNDDWLVLTSPEKQQTWIPRQHILLLRVDP